jgi:hypothetical protein
VLYVNGMALGVPELRRSTVSVAEGGVKQMKIKRGACNIEAPRIWLNLELA